MGRIRPTYIKRVSIELLNKYPQAFSKDFEANKEMVSSQHTHGCLIGEDEEQDRRLHHPLPVSP